MRAEFKCKLVDKKNRVAGYLKFDDGAGLMFSKSNGPGWYSSLRFGVRDRDRGPFIGFCTGRGCEEVYFAQQKYLVCQDNKGKDVFEDDSVRLPQESEEIYWVVWFDVWNCWCVRGRFGYKSITQVKEEGGMVLIEDPAAEKYL